MSHGRRPRSIRIIKQENVRNDKDDGSLEPSQPKIDYSPNFDPRVKLVISPSLIDRLAAAGGIPDARRADLINFLKWTRCWTAKEQIESFTQLTRKQLIDEYKIKLVAAKNLRLGLETRLPEMRKFQLAQIRRENMGGGLN